MESLNLFGQIINNPFFRDASFVLFMNKYDLFRDKILHSNRHLRMYFPDFKGNEMASLNKHLITNFFFMLVSGPDRDVDRSALFIQHRFTLQNTDSRKVLYPHFTTATDTANVQVVFQSVMEMVVSDNLGHVTLL